MSTDTDNGQATASTVAEAVAETTPSTTAENLAGNPAKSENSTAEGRGENSPRQDSDNENPDAPETFDRAYVEGLRRENAKYRDRSKQADGYARRLHTELVRATGRLADPDDLPFDAEHLEDPDALTEAIDDLLARKPHFAARTPRGDVGQGITGSDASTGDLAAILRRAGG